MTALIIGFTTALIYVIGTILIIIIISVTFFAAAIAASIIADF